MASCIVWPLRQFIVGKVWDSGVRGSGLGSKVQLFRKKSLSVDLNASSLQIRIRV